MDESPLFDVEPARDNGKDAHGDCVKYDMGIGERAYTDSGTGGELHQRAMEVAAEMVGNRDWERIRLCSGRG